MKKGDRVYVNWPTGKGGPYEITHDLNTGCEMKVNGQWCEIPKSWCEPAEPEIEWGRFVYVWDKEKERYDLAMKYNDLARRWNYAEPVHRRWDELSSKERNDFVYVIAMAQKNKHVFHEAYKLITGEEHP